MQTFEVTKNKFLLRNEDTSYDRVGFCIKYTTASGHMAAIQMRETL